MKRTKQKKELHADHIKGAHRIIKSPYRKNKHSKILLLIVIISTLIALISIITVTLLNIQVTKKNQSTINQNVNDAINLLGASDTGVAKLTVKQKIESSLGFSLEFDKNQFDVIAQTTDASSADGKVTGQEYSGEELTERRPYSIVKVSLLSSNGTNAPFNSSELSVVTNIRKSFWDTRVNPGESKIDALVRYASRDYTKENNWVASQPQDITINNVAFKKVTYDYSKIYASNFEITNRYVAYLTVQNERPYIIKIINARDSNQDQVGLLESVVASIKFDNLDTNQLAFSNALTTVLGVSTEALNSDVSNTPYGIDSETVFNVILRNQPAVVRIASSRCADINLKGGAGLTIKDACTIMLGSGSIVSRDGYVATNGHVVTVSAHDLITGYIYLAENSTKAGENLKHLLQYLLDAKIFSKNTFNTLYSEYENKRISEQQLVEAIIKAVPDDKIELSNDQTIYYLQLGQDAMKPTKQGGRMMISTSSTITTAKLISQDYTDSRGDGRYSFGSGDSSDVALLKSEGNFPVVGIGNVSSLKKGSGLTAIGYPAFVDGGLQSKTAKTKPTVTQGNVLEIGEESPGKGHILIFTSVPIAQGNSGGPAFDTDGKQIGLNTYGKIACADAQCFGAGTARDIADFLALTNKQNIKLNSNSSISELWDKGLDDYAKGNYKGAIAKYKQVQNQYPSHYLAARMQSLAESKLGSASDLSSNYQSKGVAVYVVVVSTLIVVIALGVFVLHLLIGSNRANKRLYATQQPTMQSPGFSTPSQPQMNTYQTAQQQPGFMSPPPPQQAMNPTSNPYIGTQQTMPQQQAPIQPQPIVSPQQVVIQPQESSNPQVIRPTQPPSQ